MPTSCPPTASRHLAPSFHHASTLPAPGQHHASTPVLPWCSHGATTVQPRCSHGAAMVQPRCSHGAAMVQPRCCHGAATVLATPCRKPGYAVDAHPRATHRLHLYAAHAECQRKQTRKQSPTHGTHTPNAPHITVIKSFMGMVRAKPGFRLQFFHKYPALSHIQHVHKGNPQEKSKHITI